MKPSPDEKLKVEAFTNLYGSTPEDPYYDITNDSGDLSDNYSVIDPPDEETARRIVALWNACRGISTKQLEIVVSYASDEARLSWLGWSADQAGRGKVSPEQIERASISVNSPTTPPTYTKAELDALNQGDDEDRDDNIPKVKTHRSIDL